MLAENKKAMNAAANSKSWHSLAGCGYPVARHRHYPTSGKIFQYPTRHFEKFFWRLNRIWQKRIAPEAGVRMFFALFW